MHPEPKENHESSEELGRSRSRSSFCLKLSQVNVGSEGEWKRPHIEVDKSHENIQINERLYKLMDEYIPKDVLTIEKRYNHSNPVSSIMLNTH